MPEPPGGRGLGLSSLAGRTLRLAFHAMKMRSERAALQAMPDHLLKDLGISRSQIEHYTPMRFTRPDMDHMDGRDT